MLAAVASQLPSSQRPFPGLHWAVSSSSWGGSVLQDRLDSGLGVYKAGHSSALPHHGQHSMSLPFLNRQHDSVVMQIQLHKES